MGVWVGRGCGAVRCGAAGCGGAGWGGGGGAPTYAVEDEHDGEGVDDGDEGPGQRSDDLPPNIYQ